MEPPDREVTPAKDKQPGEHPRIRTTPWWRNPVFIFPTVISLIAVAFTAGTYWDQHQLDKQQIAAIRFGAVTTNQADARKVSFYAEPSNAQIVVVQNLSQLPITKAVLGAALNVTTALAWSPPADVNLGEIPACTDVYFNLGSPHLVQAFFKAVPSNKAILGPPLSSRSAWTWQPFFLYFSNTNGNWVDGSTSYGQPLIASQPLPADDPMNNPDLGYIQPANMESATGCS